jgi:hypothetical protein
MHAHVRASAAKQTRTSPSHMTQYHRRRGTTT